MNYPAASSGVSKTTTGKILRPKGRGIHPDGKIKKPSHLIFILWQLGHLFLQRQRSVAFRPLLTEGLALSELLSQLLSN